MLSVFRAHLLTAVRGQEAAIKLQQKLDKACFLAVLWQAVNRVSPGSAQEGLSSASGAGLACTACVLFKSDKLILPGCGQIA